MLGRGAQMAETLASFPSATAGFLLVQLPSGGGNEALVRLRKNVSTLLGPERTTSGCCFRDVAGPPWWGLGVCQAWPGPTYRQLVLGLVWGGSGCGLVVC